MSLPRLIFATLLALVAPGTGIGLVSNAEEGIRLSLAMLLFSFIRITIGPTSNPNPIMPEWGQNLLILMWVWGIWAIIDIVTVIRRIGTNKILPQLRGPYPTPLFRLAHLLNMLGLLVITLIVLAKIFPGLRLFHLEWFLWPVNVVGPFFIVIADRLLRRRSGWRIFTIILLVISLVWLLVMFFILVSVQGTLIRFSLVENLVFIGEGLIVLAALVILFLPSTRAFFRTPQTQPEVKTP